MAPAMGLSRTTEGMFSRLRERSKITTGRFDRSTTLITRLRSETREKMMPSTWRRRRSSMKASSASGLPPVLPTIRP